MPFATPVSIAPSDSLFNCSTPSGDPSWCEMIKVGAKLYMMTSDLGASKLACYRSSDSGASWTRLDAAHEPTMSTAQNGVFTAHGTTFFCATDNAGVGHNVYLIQFDCSTELWGALSAAAPFTSQSFLGIWMALSGDLTFAYVNVVSPSGETVFAAKNAGGVWSTPYTIDNNNTANGGGSGKVGFCNCAGTMNGNTLIFEYTSSDFGLSEWFSYHQEIDTVAETLGYFQVLYHDSTSGFPSAGRPAMLGSTVVIPVLLANLTADERTVAVFTGPLGGPLVESGPIDPGFPGDPSLFMIANQPGWCWSADGTLALTYCCGNQAETDIRGRCRYLTTTDLITWTGETVFDNSSGTTGISVVRVSTVMFASPPVLNFVATISGVQTMFFLPFAAPGEITNRIFPNVFPIALPDPARC